MATKKKPADLDTWRGLAAKEGGSRDLADLRGVSPDGIESKPLDTAADLEGLEDGDTRQGGAR